MLYSEVSSNKKSNGPLGFWTPYYTCALVMFFGMTAGWLTRIDMSVTIVAMVNQSEITIN